MKENIGMFGQNNGNPLNKKQTNINDTKNKQEIKAHIDLLDISRFIINEKNPNVVDISYIVSFIINHYL